jgi:hypothetical protein
MSSSFFRAEDMIPIAQETKSIPADNGLDFNPQQRINFFIPPTIQFFQPNDCYIECNVSLTFPTGAVPTRLQLDSEACTQTLIRDIRVLTNGGVLLEEINNVNVLSTVRYDYDTNDTVKNKRCLTEGATKWSPFNRGENGQSVTNGNNTITNPYFKRENNTNTTSASFTNADFTSAKVLIPLPSGIFQSERVFANMLVDGVRIEILTEEPRFVFRQLDGVLKERYPTLNPIFRGKADSSANLGIGEDLNEFYVERTNNLIGIQNFPFVVGETFQFLDTRGVSNGSTTNASITTATDGSLTNAPSFRIKTIEWDGTADGGDGNIKITCEDSTAKVTNASLITGQSVMFSTAVATRTSYEASYTLKNVNLIVGEVKMPNGYTQSLMRGLSEQGTMRYDYPSYTNYKYSLLASEVNANVRLPLNNARARSILHIPVASNTKGTNEIISCSGTSLIHSDLADLVVRSNSNGLRGIWNGLSSYQMTYENRLQPSRRVDTTLSASKTSISQVPLIELEKALLMAGIEPHSFRAFQRNCVIGRALSLNDGVYDTRGKDYSVQLEYNHPTQTENRENMLIHSFVAHLRTLEIKGDSISVEI